MPLFGSRRARPARPTNILERPDYGWIWKPLLGLVTIYLVVTLALGAWWSLTPADFDVQRASAEQRGRLAPPPPAQEGVAEESGDLAMDTSPAGRGAVLVATQMTLLDTLLDKPGGYLRNDMLPPGLWLDNMPAWELGVLSQARGLAHALAESDLEDAAFEEAMTRLDGDSRDWLYPSTEHRLDRGRAAYGTILDALNEERLALSAKGAIPAQWLSRAARQLDELTYRLSASVADPEALRELEVDVERLPGRTSWHRVDDIFFEARGQAWALEHLLAAMVADYGDVLAAAQAQELVERLKAELDQAQRRLWSPVVLNGTGFGIFANHSLMMAAYTQRAARLAEALSERLIGVEVSSAPSKSTGADEASAQAGAQETMALPVAPDVAGPQDTSDAAAGEGDAVTSQSQTSRPEAVESTSGAAEGEASASAGESAGESGDARAGETAEAEASGAPESADGTSGREASLDSSSPEE